MAVKGEVDAHVDSSRGREPIAWPLTFTSTLHISDITDRANNVLLSGVKREPWRDVVFVVLRDLPISLGCCRGNDGWA